MAKLILLNSRIFSGGADLTGVANKVDLTTDREEKTVLNFSSEGWQEVIAGIASLSANSGGQWEALDSSKVDDSSWTSLGGLGALTLCPDTANTGDLAYLSYVMAGSYSLGGSVGDVAPWASKWSGTWPLARGAILNPPGTVRTATANLTAVNVGAVATGKSLYAALHVLSVSGTATPTLTVKIQSDDASGFATPTDRITFTSATARSGEVKRLAGPITDTYYRAAITITGTTPSFLFVVSVGIG